MMLLDDVQFMNKYNRREASVRLKKLLLNVTRMKLYKGVEKEMIQVI